MLTISPVTAADRADWQRLWEGFLAFYETSDLDPAITEHTFTSLLDADAAMNGAIARDADGKALGLAHYYTHPATWTDKTYTYLEDLYVDPEARGAGVGRALISHTADWARGQGSIKVHWVTHEHNKTARKLYDQVGEASGDIRYQIVF